MNAKSCINPCFKHSWATRETEKQHLTPSFSSPQSHNGYRLFTTGNSWHVVLWVLPPGRPAAPCRETQARWWTILHVEPIFRHFCWSAGQGASSTWWCSTSTCWHSLQSLGSASEQRENRDSVLQVQNKIRLLCFTPESVVQFHKPVDQRSWIYCVVKQGHLVSTDWFMKRCLGYNVSNSSFHHFRSAWTI